MILSLISALAFALMACFISRDNTIGTLIAIAGAVLATLNGFTSGSTAAACDPKQLCWSNP